MDNKNAKTLKYVDNAVFVFVFIYLASLTNSIFVNQIGYFLTLILLLVRISITKENVFKLTGLEIALGAMIGVEIIATVLSINKGQSFHNFFKFLLLIPTLYIFSSSAFDSKRLKFFFKVFMGFALVSCAIYLAMSYQYIIYNQYQIQQSGPSPFKYPITASELVSFTVVLFFAFMINEKTTRKNKILYGIGFIISSLALLSIYKRTGWMGTAAGILFILIYARKWKIVIPFFAALILLIIFDKSSSELHIYKEGGTVLAKGTVIKTTGRAYDVIADSADVYLCDYENGLSVINKESSASKLFDAPSAVASFNKWKGSYYTAYLNDTRFILYTKDAMGKFTQSGQFLSSGLTMDYAAANGSIYVCDKDSGITIFRNPANLADSIRFTAIKEPSRVFADSSALVIFSTPFNELSYNKIKNGLPIKETVLYKPEGRLDVIGVIAGKVIVSDKEGLYLLTLKGNSIEKETENKELRNIFLTDIKGDTAYFASFDKKIYKTYFNGSGFNIISKYDIDFVPGKMAVNEGTIYLTKLRESKFGSTFDKYNLSNLTRLALWSAGIKIFKDHPVFGVGNIDLAKTYIEYKNEYDKEIQGHMHNNFVHILVTLGIIGLIVFLFLLYKILAKIHTIYKEVKGEAFISSYALGTLGGLIAFIVAGLTEWNFGDHEIITMVWFTIGLCIGLYNSYKREKGVKTP